MIHSPGGCLTPAPLSAATSGSPGTQARGCGAHSQISPHVRGPNQPPRRRAVGLVRVARPAERRPILLEHGVQDLQSRPHRKVEQLRLGVNQQLDERQPTRGRRFNTGGRTELCETSSWRLLCCEACRLGLHTTRVSRAVRSRRFNFQQSVGHPPGHSPHLSSQPRALHGS